MEKSPRASPPACQPASLRAGFKSVTRFTLAGQPGPARINRAKIGPGQNGPGWPVLTSLAATGGRAADFEPGELHRDHLVPILAPIDIRRTWFVSSLLPNDAGD